MLDTDNQIRSLVRQPLSKLLIHTSEVEMRYIPYPKIDSLEAQVTTDWHA